jgi:FAD/FMN-containing dehydrogenase
LAKVKGSALSGLRDRFKGQLIGPDDPEYDQARVVWNATADRRPALVARCAEIDDVVAAVRFARDQDLLIAVRSGGHSVAGLSTCDGGIVVDCPACGESKSTRSSEPPVSTEALDLSQLDQQAQAVDLVCPVGVVGHTGVAGLTLGGGMGRLQRKHGSTIDNVLSVDLVTAEGRQLHASKDENADFFWGIRGAGANFGVVTSFELRLHPQEPTVMHGWVAAPIRTSREVGAVVQDFLRTAPDHIFVNLSFGVATDPPFPAQLAGEPVIVVGAMHTGSQEEAERDLQPLRAAMDWSADTFTRKPYLALQAMGDEAMSWGHRFYMKSGLVGELSDELLEVCATEGTNVPAGGDCSLSFWAMGGAVSRVRDDDTAFTGRTAAWWLSAEAMWDEPAHDAAHMGWARRAMSALRPFTTVGQYVNDVVETDVESVRAIYGNEKYDRLVALKRTYDPNNVFRLNQNIRP